MYVCVYYVAMQCKGAKENDLQHCEEAKEEEILSLPNLCIVYMYTHVYVIRLFQNPIGHLVYMMLSPFLA